VGEWFPIFPPDRTVEEMPNADVPWAHVPRFTRYVSLDTQGLLPLLPVEFATVASAPSKYQAFTPFQPDLGYQVTDEDFAPVTREEKAFGPGSVYRGSVYHSMPEAPLCLGVFINRRDIESLGIVTSRVTEEGWPLYDFHPKAAAILSGLRLHVEFPQSTFAARPEIGDATLEFFEDFHPVDTPPLGRPDRVWPSGLQLALPPDPTLLAQIHARFLLR